MKVIFTTEVNFELFRRNKISDPTLTSICRKTNKNVQKIYTNYLKDMYVHRVRSI